jgi:hypothetical protein
MVVRREKSSIGKEVIFCPKCNAEIPLTDAITHQIKENLKKEYDDEIKKIKENNEKELLKQREKIESIAKIEAEKKAQTDLEDLRQQITEKDEKIEEARKKELEIRKKTRELENKEKGLEEEILKRVAESQGKIKEEAEKKVQTDLEDLRQQITEKDGKINEARKMELEFRQKVRDLEEKEKDIDLEILKRVEENREKIKEEAVKKLQETYRLQLLERENKISSLYSTVDELQRKINQGSQQNQGEVLELDLEGRLHELFPSDKIEPVAKGIRGADILQKIFHNGTYCGSIIWETKNAKNWNKNWIFKLKSDQSEAKADIAVLYSTVIPEEVECFGQFDGVWITDCKSLKGLATALRIGSIDLTREKIISTGRNEKMELLYNYVNSPEFRQQVRGIADAINSMQDDLSKEKRAMERLWSKREKQIESVVHNTVRILGDMEGIVGKSLQEMKVFELPGSEE